eukprot:TRINITY_DN16930_c1_g1_i1.p3 TRINITY_DN16930_c1_g1~~TRINITY_DN16930_c1_g1_i1.p3  ORF type:complete len:109 (-),score=14.51 TRINITY_DN16930_c1_g1_i1:33-320(-)
MSLGDDILPSNFEIPSVDDERLHLCETNSNGNIFNNMSIFGSAMLPKLDEVSLPMTRVEQLSTEFGDKFTITQRSQNMSLDLSNWQSDDLNQMVS